MAAISRKSLDYTINHVILPPKLPKDGDDYNYSLHDQVLLEELAKALQGSAALYDGETRNAILSVRTMIDSARMVLQSDSGIDENMFCERLKGISNDGRSASLVVLALVLQLTLSRWDPSCLHQGPKCLSHYSKRPKPARF